MKSSALGRARLAGLAVIMAMTTLMATSPGEAVVYCRAGAYVRGCVQRPPAAAPAVRCGHVGYTRGCVVR
ncbi:MULTISPECIES: hypothetical protein [Kaistia]|uniref:Uncharacterized protein n=1 Tax=Kaistia nematophila TaxID=2994654 RepID=A0A9X3E083_9HYPH|nr:hypothetical protein [Kaistia nematophila]MBN9059320.1 hypothetical protein [Hyphomicrobiales bacterium]MCX5569229.1 hypothetical protein [Kaistia nematophila]